MARTNQESSKATSTKRKSTATSQSPKKPAAKALKPEGNTDAGKKATKPAGSSGRRPKAAKLVQVTSEQRNALIAEAAYLRAEQRGFNGDPTEDWLIAEQEIDARLSEHAIAS